LGPPFSPGSSGIVSKKDIDEMKIVTLAQGTVQEFGDTTTWGESSSAALVFDTTERAERARSMLARLALEADDD
jgi:hypothetical protein